MQDLPWIAQHRQTMHKMISLSILKTSLGLLSASLFHIEINRLQSILYRLQSAMQLTGEGSHMQQRSWMQCTSHISW